MIISLTNPLEPGVGMKHYTLNRSKHQNVDRPNFLLLVLKLSCHEYVCKEKLF